METEQVGVSKGLKQAHGDVVESGVCGEDMYFSVIGGRSQTFVLLATDVVLEDMQS